MRSLARGSSSDTVALSGQSGEGVAALLALIASKLEEAMVEVSLTLQTPTAAPRIIDQMFHFRWYPARSHQQALVFCGHIDPQPLHCQWSTELLVIPSVMLR